MAREKTKRTYRLEDSTVEIIEYMAENTPMDKQEAVDRMVKYYAHKVKAGEIDDPMFKQAVGDDPVDMVGDGDGDDDARGILDRLRGD